MTSNAREYRILVIETLVGEKYHFRWQASQEGPLPVGYEYHHRTGDSLADLAKAVVENLKKEENWERNSLCLTAEKESRYIICGLEGSIRRPPTDGELKKLGEEVIKALKGA